MLAKVFANDNTKNLALKATSVLLVTKLLLNTPLTKSKIKDFYVPLYSIKKPKDLPFILS